MELCSDHHEEVCFEGRDCPACEIISEHTNKMETAKEELDLGITEIEKLVTEGEVAMLDHLKSPAHVPITVQYADGTTVQARIIQKDVVDPETGVVTPTSLETLASVLTRIQRVVEGRLRDIELED